MVDIQNKYPNILPSYPLRLILYDLSMDNKFDSKNNFLSQIALISREFSRTLSWNFSWIYIIGNFVNIRISSKSNTFFRFKLPNAPRVNKEYFFICKIKFSALIFAFYILFYYICISNEFTAPYECWDYIYSDYY